MALAVAVCVVVLTALAHGQPRPIGRPPGAVHCWGWSSGHASGIRCRMRDGRLQDYFYEPVTRSYVRFFEYEGAFRR